MKVKFIVVGKTDAGYISNAFSDYSSRIDKFISFSTIVVPAYKGSTALELEKQKCIEGDGILRLCKPGDVLITLDENGEQMGSKDFASFLVKYMNIGTKNLTFICGGAYGLSTDVLMRADRSISLSKMTFTHQMVRLIFAEQMYRAMTIIRSRSYHH